MTTDKSITLRDFKTFLSAIEFMASDDNWTPNLSQWKKIRTMVDQIEEVKPEPVYQHQPQGLERYYQQPSVGIPSQYVDQTPTIPLPQGVSGLNEMIVPSQPMQSAPVPGLLAGSSLGQRFMTPNIDTSDGKYGSGFK